MSEERSVPVRRPRVPVHSLADDDLLEIDDVGMLHSQQHLDLAHGRRRKALVLLVHLDALQCNDLARIAVACTNYTASSMCARSFARSVGRGEGELVCARTHFAIGALVDAVEGLEAPQRAARTEEAKHAADHVPGHQWLDGLRSQRRRRRCAISIIDHDRSRARVSRRQLWCGVVA